MPDKKEWCSDLVECDLCTKQWRAVYHIDSDKLECPNCGNMVHFEIIEHEKQT